MACVSVYSRFTELFFGLAAHRDHLSPLRRLPGNTDICIEGRE
jgi:hypothetical protein